MMCNIIYFKSDQELACLAWIHHLSELIKNDNVLFDINMSLAILVLWIDHTVSIAN